ncbi:peptidoglycan recognition protein 3 [Parasteatoda tepidariorum]|uniref:peptidoglycan recognition protein 3 n=1 Tax=Parasteatoda tepidariorum TaxID=114398 RepID=UPI0039BD335F
MKISSCYGMINIIYLSWFIVPINCCYWPNIRKEPWWVCESLNKFLVHRSDWGAKEPTGVLQCLPGPVEYIIIHHTVTPSCTSFTECSKSMRTIQLQHQKDNKWLDIGYHFVIGGDGHVYEGRPWYKVGAHTKYHNKKSIGIALIGDFDKEAPDPSMLDLIPKIAWCGVEKGYLRSDFKVIAHRDAYCTTCPGDALYKIIKTWPRFPKKVPIPSYTCDVTEAPTTEAATTAAPATEAPTTAAPTTAAPTTAAPTTAAPTTAAPTTAAPTTEAPTTLAPTEAPTTSIAATEKPKETAPKPITKIVYVVFPQQQQKYLPQQKYQSSWQKNPWLPPWEWEWKSNMEFVSREKWGAQDPNDVASLSTPVSLLFIHRTGGEHEYDDEKSSIRKMKRLQIIDMDTKGHDDIGYNFVIGGDARVYVGRGWDKIGKHTFGYNHISLGIAFMGNFMEEKPSIPMIEAGKSLVEYAVSEGYLARDYKLYGHRVVSPGTIECPGNKLYDVIKMWPNFSPQPPHQLKRKLSLALN